MELFFLVAITILLFSVLATLLFFVIKFQRHPQQVSIKCDCNNKDTSYKYLTVTLQLDTSLIPDSGMFGGHITEDIFWGEACLLWNAVGGIGRVSVDVVLVYHPYDDDYLTPTIAHNRLPNDRLLLNTFEPGSYGYRATATDSEGNQAVDTLLIKFS